MVWVGLGWDRVGKDGLGCDGLGCDGLRWERVGREGWERDAMGSGACMPSRLIGFCKSANMSVRGTLRVLDIPRALISIHKSCGEFGEGGSQ